jgi:hypothetical protein
MNDWEITTTIIIGLLLAVLVIFALLNPSGRIRIGVFLERELLARGDGKDQPLKDDEPPLPPSEDDAPTVEWPARKD